MPGCREWLRYTRGRKTPPRAASIISVRCDRQRHRIPGESRGHLRQSLSVQVQEDAFQGPLQFLPVLSIFHVEPECEVFRSDGCPFAYRSVLDIRDDMRDEIAVPLADPGPYERAFQKRPVSEGNSRRVH